MFIETFAFVVALSLLVSPARSQVRGPKCHEIVIPVTVRANNVRVPPGGLSAFTISNILGGLVNRLFTNTIPVQGAFNIAGRYCEPEVTIKSRSNALQLLAHPATYDRNYVSGTLGWRMELTLIVVWRRIPWIRFRRREI
jgi:hypothetical protein